MSQVDKTGDTQLETISSFREKLYRAVIEKTRGGDGWIETSPDVVKYYWPDGVGNAGYFLIEGIKVCEYGKKEECIRNENYPLAKKLHGAAGVGTFEGRD